MPFNKTALANLGGTEVHNGEFRVHLQYRNEIGTNIHIHGPNRTTEDEAHKDLMQIRAAGGVGSTREESFKVMEAQSKLIKISAEYQKQIQQTIHRMASQEIGSDAEIDDDDLSVVSEDSCIHGYKSEEDLPKQRSQPDRSILTPLEATAELSQFQPIHATLSDLKHLLKSKADPNMPL